MHTNFTIGVISEAVGKGSRIMVLVLFYFEVGCLIHFIMLHNLELCVIIMSTFTFKRCLTFAVSEDQDTYSNTRDKLRQRGADSSRKMLPLPQPICFLLL